MLDSYDAAPEALAELAGNSAEIRRSLLRLVRRYYAQPYAFADAAKTLIKDSLPGLANTIRAGQLLAYFRTARQTLKDTVLPPRYHESAVLPSPIKFDAEVPNADEPSTTFPKTLLAANWLRERIAYTPDEFAELDADAQRVGFTVARIAGVGTIGKIRNTLADIQGKNVSVREFQSLMRDTLDVSPLSDPQLETIFRTHTGRASAAAKAMILDHEIVRDEFPYVLYSATHDSRVRPEHLAMERLGLNGTAVYRSDDPIWDEFWAPWAWNCRCEVIPLSIEDAADYGCQEAKDWLRTGQRPRNPQFVQRPPFDLPKGWVPTGHKLSPLYDAHAVDLSGYFTGSVTLSAMHAPKGGASVGGKRYVGGQFVPAAVVADASPAELKALKANPKRKKTKPVAGVSRGRIRLAAENAALKVLHHTYTADRLFGKYVMPAIEAIIDTPEDMTTKFGYNPTMSSGDRSHILDPVKNSTGLSAHFVAMLITKAVPIVLVRLKRLIKKRKSVQLSAVAGGRDDVAQAARILREVFAEVYRTLRIPAEAVPSLAALAAYIREKTK